MPFRKQRLDNGRVGMTNSALGVCGVGNVYLLRMCASFRTHGGRWEPGQDESGLRAVPLRVVLLATVEVHRALVGCAPHLWVSGPLLWRSLSLGGLEMLRRFPPWLERTSRLHLPGRVFWLLVGSALAHQRWPPSRSCMNGTPHVFLRFL